MDKKYNLEYLPLFEHDLSVADGIYLIWYKGF